MASKASVLIVVSLIIGIMATSYAVYQFGYAAGCTSGFNFGCKLGYDQAVSDNTRTTTSSTTYRSIYLNSPADIILNNVNGSVAYAKLWTIDTGNLKGVLHIRFKMSESFNKSIALYNEGEFAEQYNWISYTSPNYS